MGIHVKDELYSTPSEPTQIYVNALQRPIITLCF